MPYHKAELFNQTLIHVYKSAHANKIHQFCQNLIAIFNADTQIAKVITTGKLEMSSPTKEEVAQIAATGVLDVASLFQIPTGVLGKVTEKALSALFKGIRKKGYKKVAGLKAHMTHVELIAEALALGLTIHYKSDLLDEDTQANPEKWGKETAKRLLTSFKSKSTKSLKLEEQDTLVQQLKALFEWCVKKDYIREEPEPIHEGYNVFSPDDYSTLLIFASAELLGLSRDHFVQAQKTAAKANELLTKIESMEHTLETFKAKVKQDLARVKESDRATTLVNILEKDVELEGEIEVHVECFVDVLLEHGQGLSKEEFKSLQAQFYTTLQHTSVRHEAFLEALKERNLIVNVTTPGSIIKKEAKVTAHIGGFQAPVIRPAQLASPPATDNTTPHNTPPPTTETGQRAPGLGE